MTVHHLCVNRHNAEKKIVMQDKSRYSSWLPIHLLQPVLYGIVIIIAFVIFVLLKHNATHDTSWGATASEQLELSKALLGKNIQAVQGNPSTMGKASSLFHERSVERFVCELSLLESIKVMCNKLKMYKLTSTTTPPVGLSSQCVGIWKFGAGSPPML